MLELILIAGTVVGTGYKLEAINKRNRDRGKTELSWENPINWFRAFFAMVWFALAYLPNLLIRMKTQGGFYVLDSRKEIEESGAKFEFDRRLQSKAGKTLSYQHHGRATKYYEKRSARTRDLINKAKSTK